MNNVSDFCNRAIAYLKASAPADEPAIVVSDSDAPVLLAMNSGLLVAFLVDEGDSFAYVQNRHLSETGITPSQLQEIGLTNLEKIAKEKLRVQEYGAIYAVFLDGNFEASLMLLDRLWEKGLSRLAPSGFVIAIPARDVLAFCDVSSQAGLAELRNVVSRVSDGDHLLTPSLFRREGGGWREYDA